MRLGRLKKLLIRQMIEKEYSLIQFKCIEEISAFSKEPINSYHNSSFMLFWGRYVIDNDLSFKD